MNIDMNTLLVLLGLAVQGAAYSMTRANDNRKQGERLAVLETQVKALIGAVNDVKKGAGLGRRCADCEAPLGARDSQANNEKRLTG